MNKNLILFSTAVFVRSSNNHDYRLISKILPELASPKFEFFMSSYFVDREDEFEIFAKNILLTKEEGAIYPVMHVTQSVGDLISRNAEGDVDKAIRLFRHNCEFALKLGAKLLVLHLWGGIHSDKNIDVNISVFPQLKEIADRYNMILTIENICCNTNKPLEHMRKLWDLYGEEVKFTIDVKHAEFHKSLIETCESKFLWDNKLVPHIHISDYKGGYMEWDKLLGNNTPIRQGDVDFGYFFSFLKSIGYTGSLTIENHRISDNEDLLYNFNKAYEFILEGLS